jgi:hypothetical protein
MVYAMYHPAAALRSTDVERQSYDDAAGIPAALLEARRRRETATRTAEPELPDAAHLIDPPPTDPAHEAPTLF